MSRITIPELDNLPEASQPILAGVQKQLGTLPNLFRLIGLSSKALTAYTNFNSSISLALDAKTRERIALAVAQVNGCGYCLSAHTYLGLNLVKLSPEEIALNRNGQSGDAVAQAAVSFAAKVAKARGHVTAADLADVRAAGYSDAQIVEIVALVAESTFTNYLNEVAQTDIDFPVVDTDQAA